MARKRYDQLEELLNGSLPPGETPTETRDLAEVASTLRAMGAVIPESTGRVDIRQRLLQGMPEAGTTTTPGTARDWLSRLFRQKTIALLLACAMTFSGAAMAAASSLPGSALYPLKRAMEQARVAAALGDKNKASLQLDLAENRLAEMRRLVASRDHRALPALSSAFENDIKHALEIANRLSGVTRKPLIDRAQGLVIRQFEIFDELLRSTGGAPPKINQPTINTGSQSSKAGDDRHKSDNEADSVDGKVGNDSSNSQDSSGVRSASDSGARTNDSRKSKDSRGESRKKPRDSETVNKD